MTTVFLRGVLVATALTLGVPAEAQAPLSARERAAAAVRPAVQKPAPLVRRSDRATLIPPTGRGTVRSAAAPREVAQAPRPAAAALPGNPPRRVRTRVAPAGGNGAAREAIAAHTARPPRGATPVATAPAAPVQDPATRRAARTRVPAAPTSTSVTLQDPATLRGRRRAAEVAAAPAVAVEGQAGRTQRSASSDAGVQRKPAQTLATGAPRIEGAAPAADPPAVDVAMNAPPPAAAAPEPLAEIGSSGRIMPRRSPASPGYTPNAAPRTMPHAPLFGSPVQKGIASEIRAAPVDISISVAEFYAERGYRPLWTPQQAAVLQGRLAAAARDGLNPADYAVPPLADAQREVALTEAALAYARDAHSGRVAPSAVSALMTSPPPVLDERAFLASLSRGSVVAALEGAHPQHPQYQALRRKLAEALGGNAAVAVPPAPVGHGPALRLGVSGPRVATLRKRLGVGAGETFDAELDGAVKAFQSSAGLRADGIVGARTIDRLDGNASSGGSDVDALAANLERWRWLPQDLGALHVIVNAPAYRVEVVRDGRVTYAGRVIVGAPGTPTPVFSDEVEHVVVNPYWNVPLSIASSEMLAEIRRAPATWFSRRGYEAVRNGKVVSPSSVSWSEDALRTVQIRQLPGDDNALGDVKFLFPNQHDVYLHDTPNRSLFAKTVRALSHGCVRVDKPFLFADALLADEPELTAAKLEALVGGKQQWLNLKAKIPVHLTYFTREVGPDGTLARHADVYGLDTRTRAAVARR